MVNSTSIWWNMGKGGSIFCNILGSCILKLDCSQQLEDLEDKLRELRFVASGDTEQKVCLCEMLPE